MSLIAFAIFLFLTGVALFHVLWGSGIRWPFKTETELVSAVVGYKKETMPPPNHCYLAALAIYVPGTIALMLAGLIDASVTASTLPLAGTACVLVFLGRGIAGYVPAWRERFPREPFATYDRLYYSPLCLLLAAGFAYLLINGPRT